MRTSGLPNLIREGNTPMLVSMIQSGRSQGMQLMDEALMKLVVEGCIRIEDAMLMALDKARFEKAMNKSNPGAAH